MVETNEKLALLYIESPDKINKQKIFLEIKKQLTLQSNKIIKYWLKNFCNNYEKSERYYEYKQLADIALFLTLQRFATDNNIKIKYWFFMKFKNLLSDYTTTNLKIDDFEFLVDLQENSLNDIMSINNIQNKNITSLDKIIDNNSLYNILKLYIDKIKVPFWSSKKGSKNYYKKIFMDSLGFNKKRESKSYAELAEIHNCTRQNIRDICARYQKKLVELLEKENKLEELKQYL